MTSDAISPGTTNYPQVAEGVHISETPLNRTQAEELTRSIRDAAEVIWVLIARAHAGKAWKALGYDSWAEYVREEFNMSRSRSYQLLDQAKVIEAVNSATPEGTDVAVSEASARELKYVIQEAVPEIKEKTKGLEPEEAVRVTQEILAKYQAKQDQEQSSEQVSKEVSTDIAKGSDFENDGSDSDSGIQSGSVKVATVESPPRQETQASAEGADVEVEGPLKPAQPAAPTVDPEELARIRKNVNAAHDIYSSLAALSSLPSDLSEVISIIPQERHPIISSNLEGAVKNLETFQRLWVSNTAQDDNEAK